MVAMNFKDNVLELNLLISVVVYSNITRMKFQRFGQ